MLGGTVITVTVWGGAILYFGQSIVRDVLKERSARSQRPVVTEDPDQIGYHYDPSNGWDEIVRLIDEREEREFGLRLALLEQREMEYGLTPDDILDLIDEVKRLPTYVSGSWDRLR